MSDLTTTMPIFIPLDEEETEDAGNPGPGELGHVHSDEPGRHRGGAKVPRTLIVIGVVVVAVAGGIALTGAFNGDAATSKDASPGVTVPGGGVGATPTPTPTDSPSSDAGAAPGATSSDGTTTPSDSGTPSATRSTPSRTPRPTVATTGAPTMTVGTSSPGGVGMSTAPPQHPVTTTPPPPVPSTTTAPSTPAFTQLQRGSTGPDVSTLQSQLNQDGYGWELSGYQDGVFDAATEHAVSVFQSDHRGTSSDGRGVYGAATRAALLSDLHLQP